MSSARQAIETLAAKSGLVVDHPPEVVAETRRWVEDPGIDDPSLVNLTHLPFCTIDERTSKDLDQAVCVEAADEGFVVWYAIADAAWFVRPGSALFAEALRRGATYYLPGLVVPMLPKALSEDLISLNEGVDRRALTFCVHLAKDGTVRRSEVLRARVRSRCKTWFSAVQDFLDGGPCPAPGLRDSLQALAAVGRARLALAESRHIVQLRRAELAVSLDADLRFVADTDARLPVERYNEQVSLLCNVEGARLLQRGATPGDGVQPIYRVHEPPEHERMQALAHTIAALVARHRLDERWQWHPGQSLATYLEVLPHDRIAQAIHRQVLLSTGRASFTGVPGGHHGVGAEVYARFTAPMREVVGIFVHKEAWERLGAPRTPGDEQRREQVIAASHRARNLQRDLDNQVNRLVIDALLHEDLRGDRPWRAGTVMGLSRGKVHVQLDDPPIDLKVYRPHLEEHAGPLRPSEDGLSLRTRKGKAICTIGDAVRVRVVDHDAERDRWRFDLQSR